MNRFYVGQRVRIVGASVHPEHVGKLATVTRDLYEHDDGCYVYNVAIDGFPSTFWTGDWAALPHHIEPIDDDKPEAGSWDEIQKLTNWHPSQVRA